MVAARKQWYGVLAAIVICLVFALCLLFTVVPTFIDKKFNRRLAVAPEPVPRAAQALHARLFIADLHADPLLWNRDLTVRTDHGHIDLPRLQEGNIALQVFGVVTKVPRTLSYDRNDDRSDLITPLAMAQRWPMATWSSLPARALYQARKLSHFAQAAQGQLVIIRTAKDLSEFIVQRKQHPELVAGLLAMEGLHALEGRLENLEVFFQAGFRMMAPAHFFDNEIGGSAHGMHKGGLTDLGRRAIARMEEMGVIVDVAHAAPQTIDDILARAHKPVISSHTGVQGTCPGNRNLSDAHLRGIARTGGVVGIGLWEGAVCGPEVRATARAMRYAADLIGVEHDALGSDFDGAITAPIAANEMAQVTAALMEEGFSEAEIAKIMGGNVLRVLLAALPPG